MALAGKARPFSFFFVFFFKSYGVFLSSVVDVSSNSQHFFGEKQLPVINIIKIKLHKEKEVL